MCLLKLRKLLHWALNRLKSVNRRDKAGHSHPHSPRNPIFCKWIGGVCKKRRRQFAPTKTKRLQSARSFQFETSASPAGCLLEAKADRIRDRERGRDKYTAECVRDKLLQMQKAARINSAQGRRNYWSSAGFAPDKGSTRSFSKSALLCFDGERSFISGKRRGDK